MHDLSVPKHFATVRTDTREVLGVVGSHYIPIQNRDAFVTFDALVGEDEAIYHTAGVLGKGERIWLLAKLPDYIRIGDNDIVDKFLLLTNSHDGSSAVRVKLTPIRVVCENTLSMALSGTDQEVHIRHTTGAQERLKEAHAIFGLTNKLYQELNTIFNRMQETKLAGSGLRDYVSKIFPKDYGSNGQRVKNPRYEKVLELAETGVGSELARGTLWGAYNAVTEYVDHHRLATTEDSTRLKSMWFGSGDSIKKQAFKFALDLVTSKN